MAYSFNGSNQYLRRLNPDAEQRATMTACCMVNCSSLVVPLKFFGVWGPAGYNQRWLIQSSGTSLLVAIKNEVDGYVVPSGGTINTGQWHHVALRQTGTYLQGFIDGAKVCEAACSRVELIAGSPSGYYIGIGAGFTDDGATSPENMMNGQIAECALFTQSLSDGQILALSKGLTPERFNPLYHEPLVRDLKAGITAYNSPTISAHPRTYR